MNPAQNANHTASNLRTEDSLRLAVPSWFVSLLFHVGLLAALAVTMRTPVSIGDPDADARQVGIYYRSSNQDLVGLPGAASDDGAGTDEGVSEASPGLSIGSFASPKVDENPPVVLDLPTSGSRKIGPGAPIPGEAASRDARQMIKSAGRVSGTGTSGAVGGGTGGSGSGGGGTTFFGQRATGAKFLYLLDASGSMQDYNSLSVAKAELLASLAQLDDEQQFQIIFYSEHSFPMPHPDGRSQFFTANDVNRTKASQFIRGISPLEGTRHLEALLMALNYNPDVIYFLTDAGEPRLSAADLEQIRKRNGEKAQIHTVEFGKHADLNIESNFVRKLARENRGGYVYRDVTQFRKKGD